MTNNPTNFAASLSGGVHHSPEADVESIRDLLRGYGLSRSILKELIQNAEDSGAKSMDILHVTGDPNATHPLFRGPGLLVANDGIFSQENRLAIRQINLGTKGTEERAIGRFGKGLKSVFAWCEAFFIIARTSPDLGWPAPHSIIDFFNPWHGWLHQNWDEAFEQSGEAYLDVARKHLAGIYPENQPWLAFWFPLRCSAHTRDGEEADSFHESLPGEDAQFLKHLATDLRTLSPSLVTLRSLRRICISDANGASEPALVFDFPAQQQRIPAPDAKSGVELVSGQIALRDGRDTVLFYTGYAGRLDDEVVANLKASPEWPRVVQRTHNRSRANCPVKGEPHYAALLAWNSPAQEASSGSLEIRWCVFFPVGKQPSGLNPVELPTIRRSITLNLHGFFFLDSERLRIDGLDDAFRHIGASATGVCVEWNRTLASRGALAILPNTFAAFAQQEKLPNTQCLELASAFQQSVVWTTFKQTICQKYSWRPRWCSGVETWERLPSADPVLLIPRISISDVSQVLSRVPKLAALSKQITLVTLDGEGELPGLHDGKASQWDEALVLQLLDGVEFNATGDQAAVDWLNSFLKLLHETHSLTQAIRECVSRLPLLPVRIARTGEHRRVSMEQWNAAIASGQLFGPSPQTEIWLRLLLPALPDWSCIIHDWNIPSWFAGQHGPSLTNLTAASVIVAQSTLGDFTARAAIVRNFLSQPQIPDAICLAVRYLMHGHPAQAGNGDSSLFMPSSQAGEQIWSRLIKQLLIHEGGENSWRLLDQQWASVLSPQAQQDLEVSTIDAQGAWGELMTAVADFSTLEFKVKDWCDADVSKLLHGLFQAGQSNPNGTIALLRRLRLHTLRGQTAERVSIATADGRLGDLFVLHILNFESSIPKELVPLWERFLSTTKIVECNQDDLAATVQKKLFWNSTADGLGYDAMLDWNYVVRRCLESPDAFIWAPLIMEALSHGDMAVRGLGPKLRQTEWLPLSSADKIAPDSIILIDGLEAELHKLLDPAKDGLAGTHALSEPVVSHDGYVTLKKYFPNLEEALELLGLWLKDKSGWHLGLTESSLSSELEEFLPSVKTISDLPGADFLAKLWRLPNQAANNEWNAWLQEYILPEILRPFDYAQGGTTRLEGVITQLANNISRTAFDAYLRQAVTDSKVGLMLPRLSLVNQRGQWRPASQLIWPSTNLDPAAQLCHEQAGILDAIRVGIRPNRTTPGTNAVTQIPQHGNQLNKEPDFAAQADILVDYLKPFRNGNVGDVLPAALVAVLGNNIKLLNLLRELLQSGLGQKPDDFIALLLGENRQRLIEATSSEQFLIEVVRGDSTQAQTITGDTLTVNLTRDITSLLVGDPDALWCRYFYHYREDTACHLLRLRAIERPDDISDPVTVFASTIETILLKVHCNGVTELCPQNLKDVLGKVADAGQADLRRSQLYLLDMAEARLKELAVRGVPQFEAVLRQFSEARQARVDAELLKTQAPARAREKLEKAEILVAEAKETLVTLLQSPENETIRRTLVEAVRRKMTDFQYSLDSVALELFQNADDAVAEWEEMKQRLNPHECQFVIHLDSAQQRLELIHWGRPINRHAFAGFSQGFNRGYDQDLQKMLTLNFSDKGVGDGDQPLIVTGRFGLGFKTVFFVADQPEVISGRLAFEIRGGFYPVPLPLDQAEALREWAESQSQGVQGLVPTAIRLKWAASTNAQELSAVFDSFMQIAPLLAIFSRRIRTLIVKNGDDSVTITSKEQKLTESGRFTHIQVANKAYLCFRCQLRSDQRPASVLLPLDASGVSHLPENSPRLWITTPTTEHSDLRWAVNAPFKPDAGRQRLALNNPVNGQIAKEVAHAWLQSLLELHDATQTRWDEFARKLGLHSSVTFASWWQQFWSEMTRSWPVTKWENLRDGGQVLGFIAWGQSTGSVLRLIQQRAAIPSQLPGTYAQLVKSGDIQFSVTGLLADQDNGCLALITEWPSVLAVYPPGKTVAAVVAQFLKQVIPTQKLPGDLNLRSALKAELGEQQEANHLIAERLGQFVMQCKAIFEPGSPYAPEVLPVLSSLNQAKMLASDGQYHSTTQLICSTSLSEVIEKDEPLRAAFAPKSAVLSPGYSEAALNFFVKARGQLTASAATLKGWVDQSTPDQLAAVFEYLINGELGQQLADELGRSWLDTKRSTTKFQSLSVNDVNELERKFLRHHIWITPPNPPTPDPPVVQVMPADEAFRRVAEWWARDHKAWIATYENRTYPAGFLGTLPWPGEEEWDATTAPSAQSRWLLLFIHAALVPLGFNKIGRDQSFTSFLIENDWVDVLAKVSEDPQSLFATLDKYLGSYIQNTAFHFQMRQFIAFYAVSRNLNSFLHSLHAAERTNQPDAFNQVFSPNANPGLSGTGIVAPPLSGMLGMGTCQLLRELYRLGRLKNPYGYQYAFTPIRKVRRLCKQLFGTSEGYAGAAASMTIFSELTKKGIELKLDPTFNHCFDLPLQILAENKDLRTSVLRQEFEAEAADSIELDAAPNDFSYRTL